MSFNKSRSSAVKTNDIREEGRNITEKIESFNEDEVQIIEELVTVLETNKEMKEATKVIKVSDKFITQNSKKTNRLFYAGVIVTINRFGERECNIRINALKVVIAELKLTVAVIVAKVGRTKGEQIDWKKQNISV